MKHNQVMKSFIKENFLILIVILILFSYLGIKALDPNGWDGWGFGSAQTLMSGKYWAKNGFAKNYFLFIPSPYSKLIHYLDSEEFRTRKIEDVNGALVRNRIYYTHYPPLYLFPYASMAKFGIESRAAFRILSLFISLLALFLFYLFIKSVSNKSIALTASVYYGFSVTFLNYTDSVSIQPWTILFTFLILNLSIFAWRNFNNLKKYQKYNAGIWLAYLALSLSSYDITFFIFTYLVLFDIFILRKFLWKKWLLFASAPIIGFALQIFQNAWYLGAAETWQDIYISYAGRAVGTLKGFLLGLITPFISMTGIKTFYFLKKTAMALGSASLIIWILWKLRTKLNLSNNFFKFVLILGTAAVIQPFFVNVTGHWPYQGVLTAPFWGLVIGAASASLLRCIAVLKHLLLKKKITVTALVLIIAALWLVRFYDTLVYTKAWPNNEVPKEVLRFSEKIKTIYPNEERVAFRILPQNPVWKSQFPVFNFEYYLDMLKIEFVNVKDLLADFFWLRDISSYPFYSFIISENKSDTEIIRQELITKNLKNISPIVNIQGQYLFTVGPK